jgi:hypothetical protein
MVSTHSVPWCRTRPSFHFVNPRCRCSYFGFGPSAFVISQICHLSPKLLTGWTSSHAFYFAWILPKTPRIWILNFHFNFSTQLTLFSVFYFCFSFRYIPCQVYPISLFYQDFFSFLLLGLMQSHSFVANLSALAELPPLCFSYLARFHLVLGL